MDVHVAAPYDALRRQLCEAAPEVVVAEESVVVDTDVEVEVKVRQGVVQLHVSTCPEVGVALQGLVGEHHIVVAEVSLAGVECGLERCVREEPVVASCVVDAVLDPRLAQHVAQLHLFRGGAYREEHRWVCSFHLREGSHAARRHRHHELRAGEAAQHGDWPAALWESRLSAGGDADVLRYVLRLSVCAHTWRANFYFCRVSVSFFLCAFVLLTCLCVSANNNKEKGCQPTEGAVVLGLITSVLPLSSQLACVVMPSCGRTEPTEHFALPSATTQLATVPTPTVRLLVATVASTLRVLTRVVLSFVV